MIALMSQTKLPDSSNPLSDIVGAVHGSNTLKLEGLSVSDVMMKRDDQTLIIQTEGGSIKIDNQFEGSGVDNIYFDNGDVWNRMDLESMVGGTII